MTERGMLDRGGAGRGRGGGAISSSFPTAKDAPSAASRARPFSHPSSPLFPSGSVRNPNSKFAAAPLAHPSTTDYIGVISTLVSRRRTNMRACEVPSPLPSSANKAGVSFSRSRDALSRSCSVFPSVPPLRSFGGSRPTAPPPRGIESGENTRVTKPRIRDRPKSVGSAKSAGRFARIGSWHPRGGIVSSRCRKQRRLVSVEFARKREKDGTARCFDSEELSSLFLSLSLFVSRARRREGRASRRHE